jgi:aspartyl-tRNA(Asn)/glutamyl-tRNA(Gln) amidotransferase subunit B
MSERVYTKTETAILTLVISSQFPMTDARLRARGTVASRLLSNTILPMLRDYDIDLVEYGAEAAFDLTTLLEGDLATTKQVREIWAICFAEGLSVVDVLLRDKILEESGGDQIVEIAKTIIAANPKSVADFQGGKVKVIGFLVGQTMKALKGKANPQEVESVLRGLL